MQTYVVDKYKRTKGTIYLQGMQWRFHESITQALNLEPGDPQLTYQITTDLLRSQQSGDLIYRIDYVYSKATTSV